MDWRNSMSNGETKEYFVVQNQSDSLRIEEEHGKQREKTSTNGLETCGRSSVVSPIFAL